MGKKGGKLGSPVNNQYPYPIRSNTHLLKTDIHRYYEILNNGFDKTFDLVHKIKYIILFANSKLNIFKNKYKYRYRFKYRFRFEYRYRYKYIY
jgi:hypothetical protein